MFNSKVEGYMQRLVRLGKMEPLDIGIIRDTSKGTSINNNSIVMRTASTDKFEVINLSEPSPNRCWLNTDCELTVELLPKGSKITLTVE